MFYLESARLILREPTAGDAEILAKIRSTEFVTKYNLYEPCDSAQIQRELAEYEHVVLALKDDSKVIGCISIREDSLRYHVDSVSLQGWLAQEQAYQGYMAEALKELFSYIFCDCGRERIALQILSENHASIRLAERLGFTREGYLKRALRNSAGQVFDVVLLSMDKEEYISTR